MPNVIQDTTDFAAYLKATEAKQKVRPAREWVQELIDEFGKTRKVQQAYLPWQKTHGQIAFRPGEVTLWAGSGGQGKSLVTGLAVLSLMAQNERVCIASFEMHPKRTLERMCRQFSGQRPAGEWMDDPRVLEAFRDVYEQFRDWTDKRLWLYDQQGTVHADAVLGVIKYSAVELGITHIVVDSLMKCVAGEDDYNGQKAFVDRVCGLAREHNVHVHMVHHTRKKNAETDMPDKADVKGSGSITDQVDNLLLVWRNKKKERDMQAGKQVSAEEPDAMLMCEKQRNGEWEGRIKLWFEADSMQYVGTAGAAALNFSAWPHHG